MTQLPRPVDRLSRTVWPQWRAPSRWLRALCRRLVLGRLARFARSRLVLTDPRDRYRFGPAGPDVPEAQLAIRDEQTYVAVALGGTIGAAEAYIDGHWESDDLPGVVRAFLRNGAVMQTLELGPATLRAALHRLSHRRRENSRTGSRRNIAAHYDLGNDFFAAFLDPSMTYSAAIFTSPDDSLADAQRAKLDRLCRKLALRPQDHLLEIGTGWGSMAIHAATHYGCRVTTTTISRAQAAWARRAVQRAGLSERVRVLTTDYRDLTGRFDKIVSIEMIEAVGHEFLPDYFARCAARLAPDGRFALQAITLPDHLYERSRRQVDFIKRYIFPGAQVPSLARMAQSWSTQPLGLIHLEDITPHYATTLRHWRRRFHDRWEEIRSLGYDERLLRAWDFYLAYCAGSFDERYTGSVQLVLAGPEARIDPRLPEIP